VRVSEDRGDVPEVDGVVFEIGLSLLLIPLKFHPSEGTFNRNTFNRKGR
jgi:hypothetical protein